MYDKGIAYIMELKQRRYQRRDGCFSGELSFLRAAKNPDIDQFLSFNRTGFPLIVHFSNFKLWNRRSLDIVELQIKTD
jgi:hypothetical protein